MTKKLSCVLLIDDAASDNFFHTRTINKLGCADQVVAVKSGPQALSYLQSSSQEDSPSPNLIFLDINMPGMDGWAFLKDYRDNQYDVQSGAVLCMLSTSNNPDDVHRATEDPSVAEYLTKPLTEEQLSTVLERYFS